MIEENIFIDTNILIYFKTKKSVFFEITNKKLISLYINNELFISNQVIKEYLVSISRLSNDDSMIKFHLNDVNYFTEKFNLLYENTNSKDVLLDLIDKYKVKGKQIHDANIVATMVANNIKYLFTHNVKDFDRYSSLIKVIPLE